MASKAREELEEAILDYAQDWVNEPHYRVYTWKNDMAPALDAYDAARIPERDAIAEVLRTAGADRYAPPDDWNRADAVIALLKGENNG